MRRVVALSAVGWFCFGTIAAAVRPDFAMESDPDMKLPVQSRIFVRDYRSLWDESLKSPQADFQRQTADSIAEAHRMGMRDLEWARPALMSIVSADATHPSARFAAARTLIVIDSREAAVALYEASKRSPDMRQLIEPVLASWRFAPIGDDWRRRLETKQTRHRELLLAIRGVEAMSDDAAAPALLAIVDNPLCPAEARLAAARAAGRLRHSGLESQARKLARRGTAPVLSKLFAVALLREHEGHEAEQELLALTQDREPSVASQALARLNAIKPELAASVAVQAMQNADPKVREQGANAYLLLPTPDRIVALGRMLDDPHPVVRGHVCDAFVRLVKVAELDGPIRTTGAGMLAGEGWRGQEQAALLLGAIQHRAAAPRLVALLASPRPDVRIASAWALRKIAVPETLPAILATAARLTEARLQRASLEGLDDQAAHLFEALGLMKYAPAEPLMSRYIANKFMGQMSRSAAIWALGHLHAGEPDELLTRQLAGRIAESYDVRPTEFDRVRYMSAVSIVRMRAKSALPAMRDALHEFGPSSALAGAAAARWVIKEMTGEPVLDPDPFYIVTDWFLEPLASSIDSTP